jgi:hypothetical protein
MTNTNRADLVIDGNRAYPTAEIRVQGIWGQGRLVYATRDGWCGVQLDGETRVDEYPAQHLQVLA